MRASIMCMLGPRIPQDVAWEITTVDVRSYHGAAREAMEILMQNPPPTGTMEVRIVIGNTVKSPAGEFRSRPDEPPRTGQ
jgi:hypothetical protein